jgi:biopolymer transport protein TolR
MAQINVVPYIDVMLVLLVIFMITAPLLSQGVQVELPRVASDPIRPGGQEPMIVSVDKEGSYYLNMGDKPKEAIDTATLVHRVSAVLRSQPKTPVLVRGDAEVSYGAVVQLMSLLQGAGAPSVGLLTEPPQPSSVQ